MPTRKPRILTNLRIDEVSAVDKGAGDGTRVALFKRHEPPSDARAALMRKFTEIFSKGAAADELAIEPEFDKPPPPDLGAAAAMTDADMANVADAVGARAGTDTGPTAHIEALEALICEANAVDRASALHFLLYTAHGASLIARTVKKRKEASSMPHDRTTELIKIAKAHGLESFCKGIADKVSIASRISEHEFTQVVDKLAREADTTFVKMFEAQDDLGIALRTAHRAIQSTPAAQTSYNPAGLAVLTKAAPQATLDPRFVGDGDVSPSPDAAASRSADGSHGEAYAQLMQLVARQRAAHPELSEAQAFAQVYCDPNNHALAEAERRANRPRVGAGYF